MWQFWWIVWIWFCVIDLFFFFFGVRLNFNKLKTPDQLILFRSAILIPNPNPIPSRSEPNNFSFNSLLIVLGRRSEPIIILLYWSLHLRHHFLVALRLANLRYINIFNNNNNNLCFFQRWLSGASQGSSNDSWWKYGWMGSVGPRRHECRWFTTSYHSQRWRHNDGISATWAADSRPVGMLIVTIDHLFTACCYQLWL